MGDFKLGIVSISQSKNINSSLILNFKGGGSFRIPKKDLYNLLIKEVDSYESPWVSTRIFWDISNNLVLERSFEQTFWLLYETPEQIQELITLLAIDLLLE